MKTKGEDGLLPAEKEPAGSLILELQPPELGGTISVG